MASTKASSWLTPLAFCTSFELARQKYLDAIIANLQQRFDPESMGILGHIDTLINPATMDTSVQGIQSHGAEALEEVIKVTGYREGHGFLD